MSRALRCVTVVVLIVTCMLFIQTGNLSAANPSVTMVPVVIGGDTAGEKAVVIGGEAFLPLSLLGKVQGKDVRYDATNKCVIVSSAGVGRSDIKPVLEIVMGEPECREMVEGLGLVHKSLVAVPEKLSYYSCVIINNENAVRPNVAGRLKTYLKEGGGVVLVGTMPLDLVPEPRWNADYNDESNLKSIVDWFGCDTMYSIQMSGTEWGGVPVALSIRGNKPLGSNLSKGTVLFKYKGDSNYPMLASPDEKCEIVAVWKSENDRKTDDTNIEYPAAFAHPYGIGRVYWQSMIDDPNYPKLKELFQAGIWRAATGKNLPSR